MAHLNRLEIIGNLGRDPEVRTFDSGNKVANFTVGVSEGYKDRNGEFQTNTTWFNVVLNGSLAEFAEKYLRKGASVYVSGRVRERSYNTNSGEKKYITELVGFELQLLDKKESSEPRRPEYESARPQSTQSAPKHGDLPF